MDNAAELERITAKAKNAQLYWRLTSDEPSVLIDDVARVCEIASALTQERDEARAQIEQARKMYEGAADTARRKFAEAECAEAMLTQALSNLKALDAELRALVAGDDGLYVSLAEVQCWVDKLGTVLADLQSAAPATPENC